MKLSRPKMYVELLINEMIRITKFACDRLHNSQIPHQKCSMQTAHKDFQEEMEEINKIREEILSLYSGEENV